MHARCYRTLVLLYPRQFRREYGDQLVEVFQEDLDTRGPLRGWIRLLSDLVQSLPVQYVEATVTRPSPSRTAQLAFAAAALTVLTVVALGRYVVIAVPLALVVVTSGLLYLRSRLPYQEAVADATNAWWRVLACGIAILGGIALTAEFGPTVDWFPWHLAALLYLGGWLLIIAGLVLGVVRLARRSRRQPAGAL